MLDRYSLVASCVVNNDTGEVVLEGKDTPRNRAKLSVLVARQNRKERDRAHIARLAMANRCGWL